LSDSDSIYLSSKKFSWDASQGLVEEQPSDNLSESSLGAITNLYVDIISSIALTDKGKIDQIRPTDAIISPVKDYIIKIAQMVDPTVGKESGQAVHAPSRNINHHQQLKVNAVGLGASALAVTSHSLFSNFDVRINEDLFPVINQHVQTLSSNLGIDGTVISDLLQAMVTAYVDAMKNPFIIYAGISRQNLSTVLFMLRAGFGLNTFALIQQEGIRRPLQVPAEFVDEVNRAFAYDPTALSRLEENLKKYRDNKRDAQYYIDQQSYIMLFKEAEQAGKALTDLTLLHNAYSDANSGSVQALTRWLNSL